MIVSTITKLSNLTASFQKLKIVLDLKRVAYTGDSIIHLGLQNAFKKKRNINDIISWIKSQTVDNPDLMAEIIGDKLTCRILKLKNI